MITRTLLWRFVDQEAVVAGPTSYPIAEARRVRRQRNLDVIEIPEDRVVITDELLGKGGFGAVYIADYHGRNAAAKVNHRTVVKRSVCVRSAAMDVRPPSPSVPYTCVQNTRNSC